MDVFDSDPYIGVMPKRWRQIAGLTALVTLMTLQPVRQWFVSQADKHAAHQIRPIINSLIQKPRTGTNRGNIRRRAPSGPDDYGG